MRRVNGPRARGFAGALALTLGLTFAAPPAAVQADPAPAAATPTPLTDATNAKLAAIKVPPKALAQTAAGAAKGESKGFFKTPVGVASIILMAAGTGFMVYSAFHDNNPVHSPIR